MCGTVERMGAWYTDMSQVLVVPLVTSVTLNCLFLIGEPGCSHSTPLPLGAALSTRNNVCEGAPSTLWCDKGTERKDQKSR